MRSDERLRISGSIFDKEKIKSFCGNCGEPSRRGKFCPSCGVLKRDEHLKRKKTPSYQASHLGNS